MSIDTGKVLLPRRGEAVSLDVALDGLKGLITIEEPPDETQDKNPMSQKKSDKEESYSH